VRVHDGASNIYTFERTADTTSDAAVISSRADNDTTDIADIQMLDEETITISGSSAANAIGIDDLIVADLTTLNIEGAAAVLVNIEDTIQAGGRQQRPFGHSRCVDRYRYGHVGQRSW